MDYILIVKIAQYNEEKVRLGKPDKKEEDREKEWWCSYIIQMKIQNVLVAEKEKINFCVSII